MQRTGEIEMNAQKKKNKLSNEKLFNGPSQETIDWLLAIDQLG
jgi:hypothetical protein